MIAVLFTLVVCSSQLITGQLPVPGPPGTELTGLPPAPPHKDLVEEDAPTEFQIIYTEQLEKIMAKNKITRADMRDMMRRVAKEGTSSATITKTYFNDETQQNETVTLDFQSVIEGTGPPNQNLREVVVPEADTLNPDSSSGSDVTHKHIDQDHTHAHSVSEPPGAHTHGHAHTHPSSGSEVKHTHTDIGHTHTEPGSALTDTHIHNHQHVTHEPSKTHSHTDTGVGIANGIRNNIIHGHHDIPNSAIISGPEYMKLTDDLVALRESEAEFIANLRKFIGQKAILDENFTARKITKAEYDAEVEANGLKLRNLKNTINKIQNKIRELQRATLNALPTGSSTDDIAARRSVIRSVGSLSPKLNFADAKIQRQIFAIEREIEALQKQNQELISRTNNEARQIAQLPPNLVDVNRLDSNFPGNENTFEGDSKEGSLVQQISPFSRVQFDGDSLQQRGQGNDPTPQKLLEELYNLQNRKRQIERILKYNNDLLNRNNGRIRIDLSSGRRTGTPVLLPHFRNTAAARRQTTRVTQRKSRVLSPGINNEIIERNIYDPYKLGSSVNEIADGTIFQSKSGNGNRGNVPPADRTTVSDNDIIYRDGDITVSKIQPADQSVERQTLSGESDFFRVIPATLDRYSSASPILLPLQNTNHERHSGFSSRSSGHLSPFLNSRRYII